VDDRQASPHVILTALNGRRDRYRPMDSLAHESDTDTLQIEFARVQAGL
jgi:hypothetical protein